MSIHTKICKKCEGLFDIATNFDKCPECRIEDIVGREENQNPKNLREYLLGKGSIEGEEEEVGESW